jgi:hypothetical protein
VVGLFAVLEILISTLKEVGLFAQPDVVAVMVLPGVVFPVRETDPPDGTGGGTKQPA